MNRLSMEITPTELQQYQQQHQYGSPAGARTPNGQYSHGNSVRSRPTSVMSKASKRTTTYSVRRLNTAPPSVMCGDHEAPQRRFKSARLIGE
jgi:hypothetical protein